MTQLLKSQAHQYIEGKMFPSTFTFKNNPFPKLKLQLAHQKGECPVSSSEEP